MKDSFFWARDFVSTLLKGWLLWLATDDLVTKNLTFLLELPAHLRIRVPDLTTTILVGREDPVFRRSCLGQSQTHEIGLTFHHNTIVQYTPPPGATEARGRGVLKSDALRAESPKRPPGDELAPASLVPYGTPLNMDDMAKTAKIN